MTSDPEDKRPGLVVFDFDATITYCDSFLPFLRFHAGRVGFWRRMLGLMPNFAAWKRGKLDREELKDITVNSFFAGLPEAEFKQAAQRYAHKHDRHLLNIKARKALRRHVDRGDEVVIVTASPEEMVRPFAETFGVEVIGTKLTTNEGVLTGHLGSPNCRGPEKIVRLTEYFGERGQALKAAYGDSGGDREILAASEDPHYRDFRGPLFRLRALWVLFRLLV